MRGKGPRSPCRKKMISPAFRQPFRMGIKRIFVDLQLDKVARLTTLLRFYVFKPPSHIFHNMSQGHAEPGYFQEMPRDHKTQKCGALKNIKRKYMR